MGKALPKGLHRCEVHDRTFLTGCFDCAHERIFGVHDECSDVPTSDIVAVTEPTYAVGTANVIGTGSWTRGWLFDERFADPRAEFEQTEAQQMVAGVDFGSEPPMVTMHSVPDSAARLSPDCQAPLCCRWSPCSPCEDMRIFGEPEQQDPMDRLVDGLTVRECLARYEAWQRNRDLQRGGSTVYWVDGERLVRPWDMTHPQMAAAQSAWSSALCNLQSEQRERERVEICVDDDRWEE
jgi:hypothetical protein